MFLWSFLWRYAFIAWVLAVTLTYGAGFLMTLFGADHSSTYSAGSFMQFLALVGAAPLAYYSAKLARANRSAHSR